MLRVNFVYYKNIWNVSGPIEWRAMWRIIENILVTYIDYNVLVRAFNTHQLQFGVETESLSLVEARKVLTAIYQLISSYHFNELSIEETVETFLTYLCEILDV